MARFRRMVEWRAVIVLALAAALLAGCLSGGEEDGGNDPAGRHVVGAVEGAGHTEPAGLVGETAVGAEAQEAAADGEAVVGGVEQPLLTEPEVLASLERAFRSYARIKLQDGEYLDGSLVMLDERRLVYTSHTESDDSDRRSYSSSIRLHDIAEGETSVVAEDLPYRIDSIAYRAEEGRLEAAYYDDEQGRQQYAAWALSGTEAESIADPRWTLEDNGRWTLYRSNDAPGIWAARGHGGKPVRISGYEMDQRPLWFPGEDRFLYLAHTGNLLADGSGYEYELAEYDLAKGKGRVLPYDAGVWHIIGWAEPGKTLLVDHAFNEGEVVAYTEPRLIDLQTMGETRLTEPGLRGYNRAYNERRGELTVQISDHFVQYDPSGRIRSVSPWAYEGGRIDEVWPEPFSPDGGTWAYVADSGEVDRFAHMLILADVERGQRRTVLRADSFLAPLSWSPDGERFAVLAGMGDYGIYVGVQDTKAAWEPYE